MQFWRYLAVGAAATAVHWLLLAVLVEGAGAAAWVASGAGAAVGAQVAFGGNRWLTFAHRGALWSAWWRFMATAALGGVVGMAVVAVGVGLGLHYLLAQVLATALAVCLTFAVNRRWAFD